MKKEHAFVILGAILYGSVIVGGQFFVHIGLSLYQITFFSMLLLLVCILPIIAIKPKFLFPRSFLSFFAVYGLIGAGAELAQFGGLFFGVPIAVIAFLFYTQPLWTVIFGRLLLGEAITWRKIVATALALAGIVLIVNVTSERLAGFSIVGMSISLAGGILFSLWVIWGRKSGISDLHFVTTTFGAAAFTTLWLALCWPLISWLIPDRSIVALSPSLPMTDWLYLFIFTLIGGLIPNLFIFKGLQAIEAGVVGMILLLEPIIASFGAWLVFGQQISLGTAVGGGLILLSNYFVNDTSHLNTKRRSVSIDVGGG